MNRKEIEEAIAYFEEMIQKYPENSAIKDEKEKYEAKLKKLKVWPEDLRPYRCG